MKKSLAFSAFIGTIVFSSFVFASCNLLAASIGLGEAVFQCSVCKTTYHSKPDAEACSKTRYCPGAAKEEIEEKEEVIVEKEEEIVDLSNTIDQQRKEIADLERMIGEKLAYIQELDSFIEERRVQLGLTAEELSDAESRYKSIANAIDNMLEQKKQLQEEVETLNQTITLKEALINQKEAKINELSTTITSLNETVTELNTAVAVQKELIDSQKKTIEENQERIDSLEVSIKEKEVQIALKEEEIEQKRHEIDSLNLTLEQKTARIQELDEEVSLLEKDINNKNILIEQKEALITNLNKTVEEKEATIENLNSEIVEKNVKISSLNSEIVEKNKEITNLGTKIGELNTTITEQQTEIEEKTETIEQQRETITQLSDALGSKLNFTSKGIYFRKYVYPQDFHDASYSIGNWNACSSMCHLKYLSGNHTSSDEFYEFTYELNVDEKNIIYRVSHNTLYNGYFGTQGNGGNVVSYLTESGVEDLFQIFTGIVCLDVEKKIWIMKDVYNGYYVIVRETGNNAFKVSKKHFAAITEATEENLKNVEFENIDYTYLLKPIRHYCHTLDAEY